MSRVRLLAPAKINLGLAILGKRDDGYHEIDSVMAMVGLYDELVFAETPEPGITIVGMDDVPMEQNLIYKATQLWLTETRTNRGVNIQVTKHIPSPGGLGGGSTDAAATLIALEHLFQVRHTNTPSLAASIGADCPFFLSSSPANRARGIGTDLDVAPVPKGWSVLITPTVDMAAKTSRLYGALTPEDYGTPGQMDEVVARLEKDELPEINLLANSFDRAVNALMPGVAQLRETLGDAGIEVALSGAGPTLYALASEEKTARSIASRARMLVDDSTAIHVAPFLATVPTPEDLR
ncbi:MAG: 4-(cytidine 5'-diphospho)-2-C-methyl-D-erythritol kinase [Thermomicrobiales bacterium]|nr:4-(cytidine 5'-diphospho)-2-C-methyl-D-erythritol kinase [Thermomicrobiales bacterium]